ncbi:unnamed protein product [Notodromas monacha]|uniref:Uncharacterized protein n=1 Tax=Notodromas monacha TaxID=399045 RepID=A0A7R9BKJ3_9CRUS|nr:unnamed protein product [Notodromas monacha]CAG0915866.1 unnamed protein product [Notodromas monacha]
MRRKALLETISQAVRTAANVGANQGVRSLRCFAASNDYGTVAIVTASGEGGGGGTAMMECSLPSPPLTPQKLQQEAALDGNRNELPTQEELQILAKMREANR